MFRKQSECLFNSLPIFEALKSCQSGYKRMLYNRHIFDHDLSVSSSLHSERHNCQKLCGVELKNFCVEKINQGTQFSSFFHFNWNINSQSFRNVKMIACRQYTLESLDAWHVISKGSMWMWYWWVPIPTESPAWVYTFLLHCNSRGVIIEF